MIFYKIITRKNRNENDEENIGKQKYREATETLYENLEENAFIAVTDISEFTCTLVVAIKPEMICKYTAALLIEEFNKISFGNLIKFFDK